VTCDEYDALEFVRVCIDTQQVGVIPKHLGASADRMRRSGLIAEGGPPYWGLWITDLGRAALASQPGCRRATGAQIARSFS